jgi:nucleoside-diphosphate-sugar epimerase
MANARIVVTGAGGFLGRHVLKRLAHRHASLVALCGNAAELASVVRFAPYAVAGDILDKGLLDDHFRGADAVIHLAGPPSVRESFEEPLEYIRVHVLGTATVVDACRRHQIRRSIYVSSAEVYGSVTAERVGEDHLLNPRSPYGAAKVGAEWLIQTMLADSSLSAVILRPFSIYGPGGREGSLVTTVLRQALDRENIEVSDLIPVRDYCYVDDLARAVELSLSADVAGAIPVNIGSGEGVSVRQLADLALQVVGREIPIVQSAASDRPYAARVERLVADTSRAQSLLGWRAKVALRDGLTRTCETLKEQR